MTRKKGKQKSLADCMKDILCLPVTDAEELQFLSEFGITEQQDQRMLLMVRLLKKAQTGDTSAIREVRSVLQEAESADKGMLEQLVEAVKGVV